MRTHKANIVNLALVAFVMGLALSTRAEATVRCTAAIPAGRFAPLFGLPTDQQDMLVPAFRIDCDAVSNHAFAAFLKKNPEWSQQEISALYADERYLRGFEERRRTPVERHTPVVAVSWFAADAYCTAIGGRLPTTLEWERVAAANATRTDAADDPELTAMILDWYAKPTADRLSEHRKALTTRNVYGVRGVHGVIWEWTSDFGSFRVNQDSRGQGGEENDLFCGAAANSASSRTQYAAFMRYALRSTLDAKFSLPNLGFRCAYDNKP